ncbi:MAG: PaaI family thioesterase [Parvibaculum sp.]|nr:PaaI family thioesterase [Parvibaculum sp.]|tara:strand:- start:2863 stop:3306 length:444 start_codon:yes stop_codon:yes gene_type:complete
MSKTPSARLAAAGFKGWDGTDPFEDYAGPYFYKKNEAGEVICAFEAEPHHCNGGGFLHGGALMTFADYSLFCFATDVLNGPAVTVSFSSEFTAAAAGEGIVYSRGEIVQNTGSMVFLRGQVFTGEQGNTRTLLNFSGIVKRVKRRPI